MISSWVELIALYRPPSLDYLFERIVAPRSLHSITSSARASSVGVCALHGVERLQHRSDAFSRFQMSDEPRKFCRDRIAFAVLVRVAQHRGFLDLSFNRVAFRRR